MQILILWLDFAGWVGCDSDVRLLWISNCEQKTFFFNVQLYNFMYPDSIQFHHCVLNFKIAVSNNWHISVYYCKCNSLRDALFLLLFAFLTFWVLMGKKMIFHCDFKNLHNKKRFKRVWASWSSYKFYKWIFSNVISEAIQSRCAILRYSKLTDSQELARLLEICDKEQVKSIHP